MGKIEAKREEELQFFSLLFGHDTTTTLAFPQQESEEEEDKHKGLYVVEENGVIRAIQGKLFSQHASRFCYWNSGFEFLKMARAGNIFLGMGSRLLCTHKHRKQAHVT